MISAISVETEWGGACLFVIFVRRESSACWDRYRVRISKRDVPVHHSLSARQWFGMHTVL
jgi:hypothetical protein